MSGAASEPGLTILYPSVKMATGLFYFSYFSLFVIFFNRRRYVHKKGKKNLAKKAKITL